MDFKKVLIDVIKKKPVVFVGAGISFNSGVPTVYPLKKAILDGMNILTNDEVEELVSFDIPFESFISSLQSDCYSIKTLFDIYSLGKPNLNHFLLAHLSLQGFIKVIITTNFDTLIEQAFESIGNTKLKVFYTQKQIRNIDYNDEETILIKIHGCVTSKRTIATTLNRVSGSNSYDYRERIVTKLFCKKGNGIMSMGYSYSDAFDISPAIERCKNKENNICIVGHSSKLNEIQSVDELKIMHPLKEFLNTQKISTNFDKLILSIWNDFFPDNKGDFNKGLDEIYKKILDNEVSLIVDSWVNEVVNDFSKSALYSMIAEIFIKASKYDKAEEFFRKAISISYNLDLKENIIHYSLGLVMVFDNKGEYHDAINLSKKIILYLKDNEENVEINKNELKRYEMNFLRYVGKALQSLERYDESYEVIRNALQYSRELKDRVNEPFLMTLYGTNLGKLNMNKKAHTIFLHANKKYKQLGDLTGLSFNYSEHAKLFNEENNFKQSEVVLKKSLLISEKIGNRANKASDISDLALVYLYKNELEMAKSFFDDAFELYKTLKDELGEAICLNNYAHYFYKKRNLYRAIKEHKKAIKILSKYKNPSLKDAYENLVVIYNELKNVKKALYYLNLIKKLNKK